MDSTEYFVLKSYGVFREGSWWIKSKENPKWNAEGRGIVGGFVMPEGVKEKLSELKELYGELPAYLTYGYFKD